MINAWSYPHFRQEARNSLFFRVIDCRHICRRWCDTTTKAGCLRGIEAYAFHFNNGAAWMLYAFPGVWLIFLNPNMFKRFLENTALVIIIVGVLKRGNLWGLALEETLATLQRYETYKQRCMAIAASNSHTSLSRQPLWFSRTIIMLAVARCLVLCSNFLWSVISSVTHMLCNEE
jgi:hypothetical protein